jgi:hypothetical protein
MARSRLRESRWRANATIVAVLGLLWSWPSSGTTPQTGGYVVSSAARLARYE